MVIDSSVLVAIVTREPERLGFLEKIAAAPVRKISAASLLETRIVLHRKKGAGGAAASGAVHCRGGYRDYRLLHLRVSA